MYGRFMGSGSIGSLEQRIIEAIYESEATQHINSKSKKEIYDE